VWVVAVCGVFFAFCTFVLLRETGEAERGEKTGGPVCVPGHGQAVRRQQVAGMGT